MGRNEWEMRIMGGCGGIVRCDLTHQAKHSSMIQEGAFELPALCEQFPKKPAAHELVKAASAPTTSSRVRTGRRTKLFLRMLPMRLSLTASAMAMPPPNSYASLPVTKLSLMVASHA